LASRELSSLARRDPAGLASPRPSSESRAPRRGPSGSRAIVGSRRAGRHRRASPSRAPRARGTPARGEAAVAVRLLPRDQCRQLERLCDHHPADLSRGHLREHEVVAFPAPAGRLPFEAAFTSLAGRFPQPRARRGPLSRRPGSVRSAERRARRRDPRGQA
jgi:hypothetical protein